MLVLMCYPLLICVKSSPWVCELEAGGGQSVPLGFTAMWYGVFEAENPLGWLLLSVILILLFLTFSLYDILLFKLFGGPENSESPAHPSQRPPHPATMQEIMKHTFLGSKWRKKNKLYQAKLGYTLNALKSKVFKKVKLFLTL